MKVNPSIMSALEGTILEEVLSVSDEQVSNYLQKECLDPIVDEEVVGQLSPLETALFIANNKEQGGVLIKLAWSLIRGRITIEENLSIKNGGTIVVLPSSEEEEDPFIGFLKAMGGIEIGVIKVKK